MLLPNYTIGSNAEKIESCLNKEFIYKHKPNFLVKLGNEVPLILSCNPDKITLGKYGFPSINDTPMPWHRTEGCIKKYKIRQYIRRKRCLVPANGFFIKFKQNIYFFFSHKFPVITLGGIWEEKSDEKTGYICFSILTVPMIQQFDPLSTRMPLIISPGAQKRFLNIEKPLMDITRLFKYETNIELNAYPVNSDIFIEETVLRKHMKPIGPKIIDPQKFPEKEIKGNYYLYIQ